MTVIATWEGWGWKQHSGRQCQWRKGSQCQQCFERPWRGFLIAECLSRVCGRNNQQLQDLMKSAFAQTCHVEVQKVVKATSAVAGIISGNNSNESVVLGSVSSVGNEKVSKWPLVSRSCEAESFNLVGVFLRPRSLPKLWAKMRVKWPTWPTYQSKIPRIQWKLCLGIIRIHGSPFPVSLFFVNVSIQSHWPPIFFIGKNWKNLIRHLDGQGQWCGRCCKVHLWCCASYLEQERFQQWYQCHKCGSCSC